MHRKFNTIYKIINADFILYLTNSIKWKLNVTSIKFNKKKLRKNCRIKISSDWSYDFSNERK